MAELNSIDILCRLCLASVEGMAELTERLTYIISTCFSIKIHLDSELPHKICQACVVQLDNIYHYRKKIIKNELILLKKSKKYFTSNPRVVCKTGLQLYDTTEAGETVESDVIDAVDEESNPNDSFVISDKDCSTDNNEQQVENIIDSRIKSTDQKVIEQSPGLKEDMKIDYKRMNHLQTINIERDDTCLLRNQFEIKLNHPDPANIRNIEDLNRNKNSQEINQKSFIIIDSNDTAIEIDKENLFLNNFTTDVDDIVDDNTSIDNKQVDEVVNLKHDELNTIDIYRKFTCLTCLKVFESQKELSVHYKTVELSKAMKETRKCKNANNVKASKNDGKIVFNCVICSKSFGNKASIVRHAQVHKVERPFQCNLCSRTYKTVADILRHGVVHGGSKLSCSYSCGYTTVHLAALREHVKRHKKDFKYKCEECGKCFQVRTWYEQHRNVHAKVRPFACQLCGQAFSMARYLTAHQANVHPQSSKVKRYKCAHCALPCDSRKSLVMHMKQCHGLNTDCLCDVCGQILPDQHKLILHKSVHQSTRKFSCKFCKKTFNKKDHKTVHEKIHTGDRLSCGSCPKTFTQRGSLRRHMKRYHQGDQQLADQRKT